MLLAGIAVAIVGWGSFVVRTAAIVGVATLMIADITSDYQEGYNITTASNLKLKLTLKFWKLMKK